MSLVSLIDFKEAITVADTVDDADLQRALDAASEWIETYCGRTFEPVATVEEAREFVAAAEDRLDVPDVASVSQVAIDSRGDGTYAELLAAGTYVLYPLEPDVGNYTEIRLRPYATIGFIPGYQVRVTGLFGFGAVPAAVEQACILLANRYFHRLASPFGVLETGQFGQFGTVPEQDPDVIALLSPYGSASGSAAGSTASTWIAV